MRNRRLALPLLLAGSLGLASTGCSREALPIAVFAAAAAAHTVQAVAAHCAREDVDCEQGAGGGALPEYDTHDDPYSGAVDW